MHERFDRNDYESGLSDYQVKANHNAFYEDAYWGPVLIPPRPPILIPPRMPQIVFYDNYQPCYPNFDPCYPPQRYQRFHQQPDWGWNGNYQGDTVYGGPGGFHANRQRYYGGQVQPWYGPQGGWAPGGNYQGDTVYGGRNGYYADRQRYDNGGWYAPSNSGPWQFFDFAQRGFDSWAGYDIARRHARR